MGKSLTGSKKGRDKTEDESGEGENSQPHRLSAATASESLEKTTCLGETKSDKPNNGTESMRKIERL